MTTTQFFLSANSHNQNSVQVQRVYGEHLYANAKVIVKNLVAARAAGIRISTFFRENETTFATGSYSVHFLSLARELARNPDRHLFYAATLDEYLQDTNPLTSSILLDHDGRWQALVNLHPSASFQREPVQLPRQNVAPLLAV